MAESRRNLAAIESRETSSANDLPSLLVKLADDVATLLDQKMTLLRVELTEEVNVYIRGVVAMIGGGIVAAVGFALANIALAFVVSTLFAGTNLTQPARYALGFVITGVAYLVIGAIVVVFAKNRMAKQGIVPRRTMRELEKDKKWLQKEV
jgi:uncharacterized membrane protein YqjE